TPLMTGFDVGLAYERFREEGRRLPITAIRNYNAADVTALAYIAGWLNVHRPKKVTGAWPASSRDRQIVSRRKSEGAVEQQWSAHLRSCHACWDAAAGRMDVNFCPAGRRMVAVV